MRVVRRSQYSDCGVRDKKWPADLTRRPGTWGAKNLRRPSLVDLLGGCCLTDEDIAGVLHAIEDEGRYKKTKVRIGGWDGGEAEDAMSWEGRGFRGNGTPHEGHLPCQSRLAVVSLYGCEYHCLQTTYMRIVPAQYTSPGVNIVRTSLWGGGEGGKLGIGQTSRPSLSPASPHFRVFQGSREIFDLALSPIT